MLVCLHVLPCSIDESCHLLWVKHHVPWWFLERKEEERVQGFDSFVSLAITAVSCCLRSSKWSAFGCKVC